MSPVLGPCGTVSSTATARAPYKKEMLYKIGRGLQLLGMVLLPVAVAGNVADPEGMDLRRSLSLSALGVIVFAVGWLLQQAGRAR